MDICCAMIRCADAVFMLRGWEKSAGAVAEYALARKLVLRLSPNARRPSMSNIDKQAQYESKFSRLWERYDEASHGYEQMRDILEVTLDARESEERQILRLEKLAEAESVGADKAAASGVEWMKRCLA
jgi:hypothetical protein